jgi:hypothetical protein
MSEVKAKRGGKQYRISARMMRALETLSSGAATTLGEAAEIAGLTERAVRYAIKKENVRAWLREHVQSTFAAGQLAASRTMLGLLRSENSMSQFRAAAWVMGVNGVAPVDNRGPLVNVNLAPAGYVIDTRRRDRQGNLLPIAEDRSLITEVGGLLLSKCDAPVIEGAAIESASPADEAR